MIENLWVLWPIGGIFGWIGLVSEMNKWAGCNLWHQWDTYLMIVPSLIAGPIVLFISGDKP